MRFVLASSSPRRREMIASLGINFEIIKPEIDETIHPGEDPLIYVQRLSREKAAAVIVRLEEQSQVADAVVLAADTIVLTLAADTIGVDADNQAMLGKPADANEARSMLKRLREVPHTVYTAFRLAKWQPNQATPTFIDDLVGTRVTMRTYTDDEIESYIASGDPFDKAGSYAIQNPDFYPVAAIEGCYNNVVGLPLCAVKRALSA
ncbi:MAG TPA: Maf family protein, partial [Phototrophicaceae bacterium]|nr:Maf family protein [Phototrophicaceae bacterium]